MPAIAASAANVGSQGSLPAAHKPVAIPAMSTERMTAGQELVVLEVGNQNSRESNDGTDDVSNQVSQS